VHILTPYGVVLPPYPGTPFPFLHTPPGLAQGGFNPTQLGMGFLYPSFTYPFLQDPFAIPALPALPSFYQQTQFINASNLSFPAIGSGSP